MVRGQRRIDFDHRLHGRPAHAWDATGNRTERSAGAGITTYQTEATSNRLTALSGGVSRTYTHDANGSRTGDGVTSFAYDARGRLAGATNAAGSTQYQVNALGQRVKKSNAAGTRFFHYDRDGRLLAEADGAGAIVREYVWLEETPVAVLDGPAGNTTVRWVLADHLETPRLVTNDAGTVVWRNDPLSEPFGDAMPEEDPDGDGTPFVLNLRFPGQYFDRETGLAYNYFRDYDALTGRYVQSDPIGLEGGINTFAYVGGDPLRYTDSYGLFKVHGNWCGPNWTGGFAKPWDELSDDERTAVQVPIDGLDSACEVHDRCYAQCRDSHACDFVARNRCLHQCDGTLADRAFSFGGWVGFKVGLAMSRPGFRTEASYADMQDAGTRWAARGGRRK